MKINVNGEPLYVEVEASTAGGGGVKLVAENSEGDRWYVSLGEQDIKWLRTALRQAKELAYN